MQGNLTSPDGCYTACGRPLPHRRKRSPKFRTGALAAAFALALGSSLFAGVINTDGTRYSTNHDVTIDGSSFEVKESVTLQVTYLDGSLLAGAAGDPWIVEATPQGDFLTTWTTPLLDTATMLLLTAVGNTSGDSSTASFAYAPPAVNLDQLRNGDDLAPDDPGVWVNGNLNTSNSHYVEAWSSAYRAVMTDMPIGDTITLTIGYDIKHSDKHAFDFLTHYDRIDDPTGTHLSTYGHTQEEIDPTIGVAGIDSASSPQDQAAVPVPTVNITVMGNSQPSTAFNALPASDKLISLWGGAFVGGTPISYPTPGAGEGDLTASNSTTLIDVSFVVDSSTMILAWGGHIGSRNDWGYTLGEPNSAGGISGSPYHMRVEDWNLGNIGNQDRSLSADGVAAPPPPECSLSVDTLDVCAGTDSCVFVIATLGSPPFTYAWTGPNGFSASTDTVCFTDLQAADAGTYTVTVTDTLGLSCESDLVVMVNTPPTVTCPSSPINMFVCDLSEICIPGFSYTEPDGDVVSTSVSLGTLSGDTVCFTPSAGANVIQFIASDACGADTCEVTVNVTLNSPPVATCAGDQSLGVCDLSDICLPGFGATDSDGNLQSISVSGGTLSGDTVCFTPVVGANVITLIATDSCGAADTCTTTVTVAVNSPPTASCPGDASFTLCAAEQICVGPFSSSDPDGNISSTSFSFGTPSNDSVCFTPDTAGVYTIIYDVVDDCGASASCTTNVTVSYIDPPTISDAVHNFGTCGPGEVCVSLPAASGGAPPYTYTVDGVAKSDTVCYALSDDTTIVAEVIVTDSCGRADTASLTINASVNTAPVISAVDNAAQFVCNSGDTVCLKVTVTDPDNGLSGTSQLGWYNAADSTVCFEVDTAGSYCDQLIISDSCGLADTANFCIDISINAAPICTAPNDTTLFVCALSDICLPGFGCSDADGNLTGSSVSLGTLSNDTVCFTPVVGANQIILTCTDACGAQSSCTTNVTVTLNSAPTASCPSDASYTLCDPAQICVGPFTSSDPDGNISSETFSFGTESGGDVCFTPDTAGVYSIIYTVTDACGLSDVCTTLVTVDYSTGPTISDATHDVALCDTATVCVPVPEPSGGAGSLTVTVDGQPAGADICAYFGGNGSQQFEVIVTDSCGKADTATVTINATVNGAPQITGIDNSAQFICEADGDTVCLPFSVIDPDNGLSGTSQLGVVDFTDSTVCFFADTSGEYCDQLIVSDSCGLADTLDYCVTVTVNQAPVVTSCPEPLNVTLCAPEQVCIGPFDCTDPDGNMSIAVIRFNNQLPEIPITPGSSFCFTPADTPAVYTVAFYCIDQCGEVDSCMTSVTVDYYDPPQFSGSTTTNAGLVCAGGQVCVPIPNVSGGAPPLNYSCSGDGTIIGDQVCFNLNSGSNSLSCELVVTDDCGNADTTTVNYNADVNRPPTIDCQASATYDVCNLDGVICVGGITVNDPDNNIDTVYSNIGTYNMGSVCFTPGAEGVFVITVTVIDECGLQTTCNTSVTVNRASPVDCGACPSITIEKAHNVLQGHHVCLSVTSEGSMNELGGFDFLIAYDASALSALNAEPGTFIEGCGWEYFTYRFGPSGNCNNACPSGLIRIVGLAETNDGAGSHPICFGPGTNDPVELARICFQVTNDRTLECQFAPVRFFWIDCGDNVLSDKTGDSLFVSNEIFDYGNPNSIHDPTTGFPTFTGIQGYCLDGSGFPGKPIPENCVNFYNGGVDIICADSIDARGDVNLNGQENEIADAVMFTAYFMEGLSAFGTHVEGSIAATEINGDGIPLTVADLVYLIRVIVGDAAPLNKLNHNSLRVDVSETQNVYSVSDELGAALFVFEGEVAVRLLQPQMSLSTGYREGRTYALVNPKFERASEFSTIYAGELLQADGKLVRVEASDIDGATALVYTSSILPSEFALHQNYPNPFNPQTKIGFALPEMTAYTLTVYNLSGQVVAEFSGVDQGAVEVTWEAAENASGIYLYKLRAGSFSATRKMMLLK